MYWLPALCIVMTTMSCYGQFCDNQLQMTEQRGSRLNSSIQLARLYPYGLKQCAKECLLRTNCKSFNFARSQMTCELNKVTVACVGYGNLIPDKYFVFYDIGMWPKEMAGVCMDHGCPENTKCVFNHNGQTSCQISECGNQDLIPYTSEITGSLEIGGSLQYQCKHKNINLKVMCGKNGQWRIPNNFSCPHYGG